MFDDEDDCDGCGRFECECDEDREVDDFDRCPDCGAIDCWGCDGIWSGGERLLASAAYAKRCVLRRRRAEQQRAILARFGPRLRRAIRAAWLRRHPAPHPASCSCDSCVPF